MHCPPCSVSRHGGAAVFTPIRPLAIGGSPAADWKWWQYNAARLVGGHWFSTLAKAFCPAVGPPARPCAWEQPRIGRTVSKGCHRAAFLSSVEAWATQRGKAGCLGSCRGRSEHQGKTSPCYIRCVYDIVLGAGSATRETELDTGMTMDTLGSLWDDAFNGCPPV